MVRKRGCATDPDTSCCIVSIWSTAMAGSTEDTAPRNSPAAAPASSDVRTTMVGSFSMFDDCSTGKYISALASRSSPSCSTSPTTPITVRHGGSARFSRWPIGFSDGQYSRAIESLITTTHGDSAVSADVNDRPRSNGIPIVSK